MREFTGGVFWAHAEQSFEMVHHPVALGRNDAVVVITHTGATTASLEALRMARAAGAFTVAITGQMSNDEIRGANFHIETCEQEVAFAYSKSYTTALTVLALMIARIASQKYLLPTPSLWSLSIGCRSWCGRALALEPQVREWAKRVAPLSRIEIFGSGAAWPTASEAALKIKEACYIAAEGFETEEILHGPFSETDSRGSLIGLFTGGSADERGRQILRAAGELKMPRLAITVPSANHDLSAERNSGGPRSSRMAFGVRPLDSVAASDLLPGARTRRQSRQRPHGATRARRRKQTLQILSPRDRFIPQFPVTDSRPISCEEHRLSARTGVPFQPHLCRACAKSKRASPKIR